MAESDGLSAVVAEFTPQEPSPQVFMEPGSGQTSFVDSFPQPPQDPDQVFNPAIHATKNGMPVKTKDGKRYARKRGPQKGGSAQPSMEQSTVSGDESGPPPDVLRRAEAEYMVGTMVNIARATLDPDEWEPDPGIKDAMVDATDEYFRVSGFNTLPPWCTLILCMGGLYILPNASKPKTRAKLAKMFGRKRKTVVANTAEESGRNGAG